MTKTPLSKDEAGALLRRKRESLGLTQEQVVIEAGIPTITQLSEYENGKVSIARSKYFPILAGILNLTDEEVRSINPAAVFDAAKPPDPQPAAPSNLKELTEHDLVIMPVYGLCEAGKPVTDMEEDEEVSLIAIPRRRWRPGALIFRVQGESMLTADGRGIAPDDLVMVDTRLLDPVDGKVYVIHIPGNGVTLKRLRFLGGQAWLFSDNPDQQAFPPFQTDNARIVGRVYSKISVEVM